MITTLEPVSMLFRRSDMDSRNQRTVSLITTLDSLSLTLWGSSSSNLSARSPVPMPPTDVASFQPWRVLDTLVLPIFLSLNLLPYMAWYSGDIIRSRNFSLSRSVRPDEYEKAMYRKCDISNGPHSQAGRKTSVNKDFIAPGKTLINRF